MQSNFEFFNMTLFLILSDLFVSLLFIESLFFPSGKIARSLPSVFSLEILMAWSCAVILVLIFFLIKF